ncbi:phosphatase PAP2 family protein [Oceanobacillus rekensis]|uniref:phosphatase PAP2 family protein n=1 Tax=Oceanobacillus rekensis TaxID=937927 RepID=UPI000B445778|nr:phosphatase PAP2 family protein [Oceanobacillus rekensis]
MKNRKSLILFCLLILLLIGLWVIQIIKGYVPYIDRWTRELVMILDNSIIYDVFYYLTKLGSGSFLTPFVIIMAIVIGVLLKNWFAAFIFASGTLMTHVLNILIKKMVDRERPSISIALDAEGYSFPSGHAMISIVCYGLLVYFLRKKIRSMKVALVTHLIFALLIFLVGISRYVINVHYLTDVLAGFGIGFMCLVAFIYLYEFFKKNSSTY